MNTLLALIAAVLDGLTGCEALLFGVAWLITFGCGLGIGAILWRPRRLDLHRYELPKESRRP
jgi:hypothetical protein